MTSSENVNTPYSLVNNLENKIIHEALLYYESYYNSMLFDNDQSNLKKASDYFNDVIPGKIYDDIKLETFESLRVLPSESVGQAIWVTLSLLQENSPRYRVDAFHEMFRVSIENYQPDIDCKELTIKEKRYINVVLDKYNVHFSKFVELFRKLVNDSKLGKLDLYAHIFKSAPRDPAHEMQFANIDKIIKQQTLDKVLKNWTTKQMTLKGWNGSGKLFSVSSLIEDYCSIPQMAKMVLEQVSILYHEYVEELFNDRFKHPFEDIDNHKKRTIAQDDFDTITELINGQVNPTLAETLCDLFYIRDYEKARKQIKRINRKRVSPEIHYDIHNPECLANAEVIVKYHDFLKEYLNHDNGGINEVSKFELNDNHNPKIKSPNNTESNNKDESMSYSFRDIWLGTDDEYNKLINLLTSVYLPLDCAFVKKEGEKLIWQSPAKYGRDQYLRGLLYTCLNKGDKGLISNHSSTEFAQILSNTFNIVCKPDGFKSIPGNPPKAKYLDPFENL